MRFVRLIEQLLGKLHRPGDAGDPSIKLAIDEIRAAPEEQTDRRGHDQVVAQVRPGEMMTARIVKCEKSTPIIPP